MSRTPAHDLAYEPDVVHPPGAHLAEWLEEQAMSQAEFARRVGLSNKHVNQIISGGSALTPDVAIAFEKVTSLPARLWAQIEAGYRSHQARLQDDATLMTQVGVLAEFPIREMEKHGYFAEIERDPLGKLRQLLKFFGVATVEALREVAMRPAALRSSRAFKPNEAALAAWIRHAEIKAASVEVDTFDSERCAEALEELRGLTRLPDVSWIKPLKALCASIGIAVVIEPELPGCRINGATRWLSPGRAMIALSFRHKRHDIFWFTFFHELGHLLRHSKRETFIDAVGLGVPEDLERDADRFAGRVLIPVEHEQELPGLSTEQQVVQFADRIGVSPAIVVGRLHHEGLVPASQWQRLIPKYKFSVPQA